MNACHKLVRCPPPGATGRRPVTSAMPSTPAFYRAAARVASSLAPVLALASPKLAAGHRGRHGAVERLSTWSAGKRDAARPLVWLHASSVGEGLQAESVLHELRRRRPDAQFVYTHFSPLGRVARPPASGRRRRLSPLRPPALGGGAAGRAPARPPRLLEARSLARVGCSRRCRWDDRRDGGGHGESG